LINCRQKGRFNVGERKCKKGGKRAQGRGGKREMKGGTILRNQASGRGKSLTHSTEKGNEIERREMLDRRKRNSEKKRTEGLSPGGKNWYASGKGMIWEGAGPDKKGEF